MLPAVNSEGSRYMPRRNRACFWLCLGGIEVVMVHARSPRWTAGVPAGWSPEVRIAASTLAPPLTRSPTLTRSTASAGSTTSTLEPNLMRPTRWPRSTVWPSLAAEDDAPREQAGNLLEGDFEPGVGALAAHGDGVLLVALRRGRIHGVEKFAFLVMTRLRMPPMGARFTCTSKTLRKMLMRWRGPAGVAMEAVSVTRPSPGETIKPSPAGIGALQDREKTRGKTPPAAPGVWPNQDCR